ncbi:hypothetical protein HBI55_224870 [Parastagonospora nodorum]|nr:hypothetical protein HBI10_192730 [Parastagonospora nodorum]KAH4013399.1 hypothetical protein HBI09_217620 [Parastagonospora nodorum]KAH4892113.1 hypothetical protein HBH74_215210 [Parastagonospora nodorum]KAH6055785.1 hypothetical protein HBI66_225250 [Parastagonospora nodorum]KAH6483133.1 hypothetical protein HBI55_224870 [Parastagonospora nodorum]
MGHRVENGSYFVNFVNSTRDGSNGARLRDSRGNRSSPVLEPKRRRRCASEPLLSRLSSEENEEEIEARPDYTYSGAWPSKSGPAQSGAGPSQQDPAMNVTGMHCGGDRGRSRLLTYANEEAQLIEIAQSK